MDRGVGNGYDQEFGPMKVILRMENSMAVLRGANELANYEKVSHLRVS